MAMDLKAFAAQAKKVPPWAWGAMLAAIAAAVVAARRGASEYLLPSESAGEPAGSSPAGQMPVQIIEKPVYIDRPVYEQVEVPVYVPRDTQNGASSGVHTGNFNDGTVHGVTRTDTESPAQTPQWGQAVAGKSGYRYVYGTGSETLHEESEASIESRQKSRYEQYAKEGKVEDAKRVIAETAAALGRVVSW